MSKANQLGIDGEAVTEHHYRRAGFEIVARNWRCPDGELDVVVRRGELLVFCEVKTRSSDRYGGGAAAVDRRKQRRVRHAAAAFLREWRDNSSMRFDAAVVRFDVAVVRPGPHGFSVELIEAAF
jgi:putative endonuclease